MIEAVATWAATAAAVTAMAVAAGAGAVAVDMATVASIAAVASTWRATGMPEKIVERAGQAQLSPVSATINDGLHCIAPVAHDSAVCVLCAGKSTAAGGTIKR